MSLQYTPYVIPLVIGFFLALGIIGYTWTKRTTPGVLPFMFMMLGVAHWLLSYALGISHTTLGSTLFWANSAFVGIATIPVAWLLFCQTYTSRGRVITPRYVLLLLVVPTFTLVAVWTNESHHLLRRTIFLDSSGPFVALNSTFGPLFWLHTAYSYTLIAYGTYLLFITFIRSSHLYRMQMGVMLAGSFIPWVANAAYILFLTPIILIDPTPLVFLMTGTIFAWGMFGFRLMDLAPVARNWVIEQMDDGMIVLDNQNRVVDINPAAADFVGRTTHQLIGIPGAELFAQWPELVAQYRDVEKATTELEFQAGPETRYISLNILPLYDKRKRLNGRLLVIRDVTLQREAGIALQLAKEKADEANRAKSTFLANMSHELRTPLTAIIGYSELLEEQAHLEGNTYYPPRLDKIKSSATHLLHIVSDILDLSKAEAGQMKLYLETFNVRHVVEVAVAMVQPLLVENQNELSVEISDAITTMYADQMKVRQILLNLLHNAAKFTDQGRIELIVRPDETNVDLILFEIKDSGIGLSPEQITKIFQPFSQADESTTRRFGGTGLGLAVSQHFCQMMQGNILISSRLGHGSCFTVSLPAVVAAAEVTDSV